MFIRVHPWLNFFALPRFPQAMFPGSRQTNRAMKQKLSLVLALIGVLLAADAFAAEDWSAIRSHNVTVRLTGVRRIQKEPFNLVARFVTDDRAKREFTVEFPSNPPDAHVATIMNVIDHCVAWTTYRGQAEWPPLNMEVLLSVPPDAQGALTLAAQAGRPARVLIEPEASGPPLVTLTYDQALARGLQPANLNTAKDHAR